MANHTNREDFAGHDRTSSIDFPSSPPHRVGPAIRRARTTSTIIQRSWSVADDIQMVDMQLPTLPRDETRGTSNSWTTCGATDPNYDAHQDMIRQGVAREEYPYGNNSAGPSGFGIVVVPPVAQREEYSFIQKMNRTYTSTNLGGHSYANSPASFSSSDSTTLAGSSSPIVKHDNKVIAPSSSFAFNSKARRQDKQHPDGGVRAWLCILGCAFMLFTTFGFQTCVGLVLQHLRLNQLKSSSLVEISWIMATFLFLGFAPQAWMAVLFDRYGSHVIAVPASFLYFAMFMILGRCTQYYQFFLTLSVLGGVCCAAITAVGEKVIGHWFKENHGLASFMAMLGAVMGGVFFPLTLKELLESFGWTWAMQGLGFVVLLMLIIGNILVQGRVRSVPTSSKVDWSCFQDGRFTYLIAAMLGESELL